MLRKILAFTYVILLIMAIYLIQIYVIDSRTLFGVKPNLILISVVTISLWYGLYIGSFYSLFIGILTDCIFGNTYGLFTVSYAVTGILVGFLNYNYRKENKVSLIYVTILATALFEIIQYLSYIFISNSLVNIFYLIKQIFLAALLNICISYILYGILYKITSYVDEELVNETPLQDLR